MCDMVSSVSASLLDNVSALFPLSERTFLIHCHVSTALGFANIRLTLRDPTPQ